MNDIPLIGIMVASVADYAHDVRPDAWRRYVRILIDGLFAARPDTTPLEVAPLTEDEVAGAMRAWHPHHR